MKKFLMFIIGFITASALSLVIVYRLIRFMTEILARLDALDTLKEVTHLVTRIVPKNVVMLVTEIGDHALIRQTQMPHLQTAKAKQ